MHEAVRRDPIHPFSRKLPAKRNLAVPSMSQSHDSHRKAHSSAILLATLIEGFRGFFVVVWPSKFFRRASARPRRRVPARQSLCNWRPKPIVPNRKSHTETCCFTDRCACSVIRHSSSRNNFNPHSRTFSIAARIRRTSVFLQVSLSKIRGDIHVYPTCTWLAADFR